MSFEANDMNAIHLGNYEEFFVLYMDKELSKEQVKMVDEFLSVYPDLKAELEILMSTKLPSEEFAFDKKDLLADSMKQTLIDEELLLYIDNELPADKKKTVELEISSNKDYQLQHQLLLQTKLDSSDKIEYPSKKELYRRTERMIAMKVWMRVAAAVVVIAIGGIVYFKNSSSTTIAIDTPQTTVGIKKNPIPQNGEKKDLRSNPVTSSSDHTKNDQVAVIKSSGKERKSKSIGPKKTVEEDQVPQNAIALNNSQQEEQTPERPKVRNVQFDGKEETIAMVDPKVSINKADVTSPLTDRINNSSGDGENDNKLLASNDRKGSVKGFLRKATRLIEKRTGIDPTNENGELLIGAVAINLK